MTRDTQSTTPSTPDAFLTVQGVMDRLGVSKNTVLGWIRSGELDAIHVGAKAQAKKDSYRIAPESLEEFCLARRVKGPRTAPKVKGRPRGWRPPSYV